MSRSILSRGALWYFDCCGFVIKESLSGVARLAPLGVILENVFQEK